MKKKNFISRCLLRRAKFRQSARSENTYKKINPYGQVRNSEYFIYQLTQRSTNPQKKQSKKKPRGEREKKMSSK